MTVMAGAIIAPALPDIGKHFPDASSSMVKLLLTMPAVFISLTAFFIGSLSDKYGRKNLLLLSLLIYGLSGFSGFFIDDFYILLISRAGLGLGVAGIMSLTTTLIGDYFEGAERNNFMGLQASTMSMGGVLFLILGGILADISWRLPFAIYLMAFLVMPLAIFILYEPDIIKSDQTHVAGRPKHLGPVALIFLLGLLSMMFFYMIPTQIPFMMDEKLNISNSKIGMAIAITTLTGAITSFYFGRIKSVLSHAQIFIIALILISIGFFMIAYFQTYSLIVISLAIAGLGFGTFIPNCNLWLMSLTLPEKRGFIIGAFSSALFSGQFISPLVMDVVVGRYGFGAGFYVASGILLMLCLPVVIVAQSDKVSTKIQ